MKKKYGIILLLFLSIFCTGCKYRVAFDGSKTGNDDQFLLEYKILNTSYSHDFSLEEGDSIRVLLDSRGGSLSITIRSNLDSSEHGLIYSGTNPDLSEFTVNIPETGIYTVTVSGKKACGGVSFYKVHAEEEFTEKENAR